MQTAFRLLAIVSCLWIFSVPCFGQSDEQPAPAWEPGWEPMAPAEAEHGSLLLETDQPGSYRPAQGVETDVSIRVSGMIARTVVRQRFANPDDAWREGIYVFPLPTGSAVDAMRLAIGERIVEGEIQERQQAKQTYEAAKKAGKKASLLQQDRPNLFTTSVANIGPEETVDVVIEYQEVLRWDSGSFRLRFPMVVNPRYAPGANGGVLGSQTAERTTDETWNPVNLEVELEAGLPLEAIHSSSHDLRVDSPSKGRYRIELADGRVPANRDFVLEWRPQVDALPRATAFVESRDDADYLLLMIVPPKPSATTVRIPRETIFVVDRSGSMAGEPLKQAKQALLEALDRLPPEDHFNVIFFSDRSEKLFESSVPADDTYRRVAQRRIEKLSSGGGTEMLGALEEALTEPAVDLGLRQVIFITDGSVGNEDRLFAYIRGHLGRSRLFTVGIGSAPNAHFMEKAAAFGAGTFTFIGDPREVSAKMGELFAKIEHPVLRDVEMHWPDPGVTTWPRRPGDLYLGEPLLVTARSEAGFEDLLLDGWAGNDPWSTHLVLEDHGAEKGIHRLWARKKIAALEDGIIEGQDPEAIREQIVELGLAHRLITRHTSLVAVEKTPSRSEHEDLHTRNVMLQSPAGVLPQGAGGWVFSVGIGLCLALFGLLLGRRP